MKHQTHNRILSFFLALVMLCTNAPFPVNSVETEKESALEQPINTTLVYDYDTLKITKDGTQISSLSLQSHEKIEVSADGISANAEYQWQVQHPENDDVWVNVYDGTNQTISVTAALVGNVLRADGTAKLRCRAYTEDYAYLTSPMTVTLRSETQSVMTLADEPNIMLADVGDGNTGTPEFVTITMQYRRYDYVKVWDDVKKEYVYRLSDAHIEAFTSYKAMIPYGKDFTATVTLPTVVGYAAYYEDSTTATKEVTLNFTDVVEDIVVNVYYKPADVDYTVRYYFQNIYDDQYMEDTSILETLHMEGPTGSAPDKDEVYVTVPGFTSLFYQPDTIAADGSTVFEVYYERNYYLMEFDCDGGYGADPVYVRYGTHISIPTPRKSGWVFTGWDLVKTDNPNNEEGLGSPIYDENHVETGYYAGDGGENNLPPTMPTYNSAYKALWSAADTTFTVAYWIVNDDGTRTYIGSHIEESKSDFKANGDDYKLEETDANGNLVNTICGVLGHDHDEGCYTCGLEESAHTQDCFSGMTLSANDPGSGGNAIRAFEFGNDPEDGYIYVVYSHQHKRYWPKLYLGGQCYVVNNTEGGYTESSYSSIIEGDSLGSYTGIYNGEKLTVTKYRANTNCTQSHHLHGSSCCTYKQHAHSSLCYQNTRHMKYLDNVVKDGKVIFKTDKNVTVEGDGSTVVNVYYQYKEYTLKFYYAATTGGTETDNDNDPNTYDTIRVVGGSTWNFGTSDVTGPEDGPQLANVGGWGDVDELPTLNTEGEKKGYTKGTLTHNNTTYHYISFEARYGGYIADLWPCAVFNSVTRVKANTTHTNWDGMEAFVSAWNGEHYVKYSQDNTNETIKGKYEVLDDNLLFDSRVYSGEYDEVSFLCFWENGTDLYWSVPELYRYNIYLEAHKGQDLTGLTTITRDGTTYYLANSYDTCDDSDVHSQTQVALTGYEQKLYTTARDGFAIDKFEYKTLTGTTDETLLQQDGYFDASLYSQGFDVYFYYTLKEHVLKFMNHNEWLTDGEGSKVKFGTSLKNHGAYVDEEFMAKSENYPETLEPGAYWFEGWYTSVAFLDGTKMDWNSTMPDSDFTVYARWKPVIRNVYFYATYPDVETGTYWYPTDKDGNVTTISYPIPVEHGTLLGTTYTYTPERDGYTFVGWFYMDENGKKRFAPDSMEVKRDLHLFAEWRAEIDTTYEVSYVLKDAVTIDGTTYAAGTSIADVTVGHSTAGKTKTFSAKGADPTGYSEVYPAFETGFFPEVGSHSILMDPVSTNNTYEFKYVCDAQVKYKVRYVDYATKQEIATSKEAFSSYAVHTERFLPIPGYVPMNGYYYITKTLASDGDSDTLKDENIFTFYYMKDDEHGAYAIEHYLQNLDGTTYRRATYFTNTADLFVKDADDNKVSNIIDDGDEFTVTDYDGYDHVKAEIIYHDEKGNASKAEILYYKADGTLDKAETVYYDDNGNINKKEDSASTTVSGTLDVNGLTIKLYYNRKQYDYQIEYRDISTDVVIQIVKTDRAMLESVIEHTADDTITTGTGTIYNYVTTGETVADKLASRTKSLTIRVPTPDDPGTTDVNEFKDPNVLVFYYAQKEYTIHYVPVCSDSDRTGFGALSLFSEIAPSTANLSGSTATAATGYRFKGWYSDKECKNLLSELPHYKPASITPDANDACYYYALFEPIITTLTITKEAVNMPGGANHSFVFSIVGKNTNNKHINLTVTINGSGSLTIENLPIGEYTVTELTDWSYQYTADLTAQTVETVENVSKTCQFKNTYKGSDWLGDEDYEDNEFKTYTP